MQYRYRTFFVCSCLLLALPVRAEEATSEIVSGAAGIWVGPEEEDTDEFATFWHLVVPLVEEVLATEQHYDRRDRLLTALGDARFPGEVVARMGAAVRVLDSLGLAGRHDSETVRAFLLAALHPDPEVRIEAVEAAESGASPPRLAVVRAGDGAPIVVAPPPSRPEEPEQLESHSEVTDAERADRIREYKKRRLVLRGSSVVRTTGHSSGYATGMPGGGSLGSSSATYTTRVVGSDWRVETGLGKRVDAYRLARMADDTGMLRKLRFEFERRQQATVALTAVGAVLLSIGVVVQVVAISVGPDDGSFLSLQPTAVSLEASGSALMVGCAISWTGYPSKHRRVREHYSVEAASAAIEEYNGALRDELGLGSDDVLFLDLQGRGPSRPPVQVAFGPTGFQVAF